MIYTNDVPIKRHTKIKSEANLFDPEWELYFEQRLVRRWKETHAGRKKLVSLWFNQNKRCLICDEPVTFDTGWNIHHIVEKCNGGSDLLSNLVLLHPNCHRQLHAVNKGGASLPLQYQLTAESKQF